MKEIQLSEAMRRAGDNLGEGRVIFAYRDGKSIRMETENGVDPWVWRGGKWRRMSDE